MTLKTPLPEKLKAKILRGDEGNLVMHTIVTQNEIIDYLDELTEVVKRKQWELDNEYARGFNDGAFEQTELNKKHSLKETLLGEINKLGADWWEQYEDETDYISALSDVKDIINRLMP